MEIVFSNLILQCVLQVCNIARKCLELAIAIPGLLVELVSMLVSLIAKGQSKIARIKVSLLALRGDSGWWSRLFTALKAPRLGEVEVVLEHASLAVMTNS